MRSTDHSIVPTHLKMVKWPATPAQAVDYGHILQGFEVQSAIAAASLAVGVSLAVDGLAVAVMRAAREAGALVLLLALAKKRAQLRSQLIAKARGRRGWKHCGARR